MNNIVIKIEIAWEPIWIIDKYISVLIENIENDIKLPGLYYAYV